MLSKASSFAAQDKIAAALNTFETEFGKPVQTVKEITSIPNPSKAVLLVQFVGGLKVKLCVSTGADFCFESTTRFADLIAGVRFPKVLLRGESWAAFEWIEGKPVSELRFSTSLIEAAARVLISVHKANVEIKNDVRLAALKEAHSKLQKNVPLLISHDIITEQQSQMIAELHDSLRPELLNISLIHGDFSPANLVVCGNELSLVDNEKMRVHVTEYDLCRASTFWDEWGGGNHLLLDTHQRQSSLQFDPASLRFWEIYDLVYRIGYRLSALAERNDFCIMKLRRLLATGVSS
jgi:phosphotransferase family enzyme